MLAAAHVLAMDAKNLLDVVDCIRQRHPAVDWRAALQPENQPQTGQHEPLTGQNQPLTGQNHQDPYNQHPVLSNQSSLQEDELPKPDFKINQPVTTQHIPSDVSKEPSSLTSTANRVSALIHNYNLYGNVREAQHIYGNTEFQSTSIDEPKVDSAPMESVKSRVQAISGKVDAPIYSVTKKMIPVDHNIGHTDQG
ncbi:Focal Adhesion Kinase [Operophtera brumata]|uniref:Focal Adhesion Kinase n=1 Tax=Operophtera brumata TaxID=104452 RepID=A0A0L7LUZ9_OPEBR|nr:Focal Adhesion Kinase [Operophtera brumata]